MRRGRAASDPRPVGLTPDRAHCSPVPASLATSPGPPARARRWAWALLGWLVVLAVVGLGPAAQAAGECKVEVRKGDTLDRIAARNGVAVSDLVATNPALRKNPDLIRVGQVIDVCAARKRGRGSSGGGGGRAGRSCGGGRTITVHTVGKGDTLSRIASRYGVSEEAIVRRNGALAKNRDMLRRGQKLEICVGRARAKNSKLCGYRTPVYRHTIIPGEHLGYIAGRYGVRRKDLMRWNPSLRQNPDMLRVGKTLLVCPEIAPRERQKLTHAVQSGETFGAIARRYDVTRSRLLAWQRGHLSDPNQLRAGQKLTVWVDGGVVPGFADISDDKGVLRAGVQLPPGKHYTVKWPAAAWGTVRSIRAIQQAVATYQRRMPGGPKVHIGDISKKAGGKFPPHISHQHGRDVDVGYVLKGKLADEKRFRSAGRSSLDVARTWTLVKAFIDTGQVKYIFMDLRIQGLLYEHARKKGVSEDVLDELFQYPRRRRHGIIQHWRGHVNHFHVRFRK